MPQEKSGAGSPSPKLLQLLQRLQECDGIASPTWNITAEFTGEAGRYRRRFEYTKDFRGRENLKEVHFP